MFKIGLDEYFFIKNVNRYKENLFARLLQQAIFKGVLNQLLGKKEKVHFTL